MIRRCPRVVQVALRINRGAVGLRRRTVRGDLHVGPGQSFVVADGDLRLAVMALGHVHRAVGPDRQILAI